MGKRGAEEGIWGAWDGWMGGPGIHPNASPFHPFRPIPWSGGLGWWCAIPWCGGVPPPRGHVTIPTYHGLVVWCCGAHGQGMARSCHIPCLVLWAHVSTSPPLHGVGQHMPYPVHHHYCPPHHMARWQYIPAIPTCGGLVLWCAGVRTPPPPPVHPTHDMARYGVHPMMLPCRGAGVRTLHPSLPVLVVCTSRATPWRGCRWYMLSTWPPRHP